MPKRKKISLCLWFDGQAEEATAFYTSLLPNSRIDHLVTSTIDWPGGKVGDVILVAFTLAGASYQALNGDRTSRSTIRCRCRSVAGSRRRSIASGTR